MLTQEQIAKINKECPYNQGVFVQPYGIPVDVKEAVVYGRFETGGVSGGSCWDDSDPQDYYQEPPEDRMKVLDLVLKVLKPDLSYLDYKMISRLIRNNTEVDYQYYGNQTDWMIEYIPLSDLYKALDKLK